MEGKQAECQSPKTSDHLRFQATEMISGVVAAPFPSFQRRGGRAAAGVVSKGREAHLICWNLLTVINPSPYRARASRPVCAAKERNLLLKPSSDRKRKLLYLGTRFAQQFAFLSHGEEKQPRKNNQ